MKQTTTTPATEAPARTEAYDYGYEGLPFCPPPPAGLSYMDEAAWVADFHQGRADAEAAAGNDDGPTAHEVLDASRPLDPDVADYLADKRQMRKEEEAARKDRAHQAAEQAKQEARDNAAARRKEDGQIRGYEDGLAGINSPARTKGVDFTAYSAAYDRGRREAERLAAANPAAYEWGYKAGQKHAALGETAANPFVRGTAPYAGYGRGYDRQIQDQANEGLRLAVACEAQSDFPAADLDHPYQVGRHGGNRKPPAGLTGSERRDWLRKYDAGAESCRGIRRWIAALSPVRNAPDLIAEWHRNRRRMGLGVTAVAVACEAETRFPGGDEDDDGDDGLDGLTTMERAVIRNKQAWGEIDPDDDRPDNRAQKLAADLNAAMEKSAALEDEPRDVRARRRAAEEAAEEWFTEQETYHQCRRNEAEGGRSLADLRTEGGGFVIQNDEDRAIAAAAVAAYEAEQPAANPDSSGSGSAAVDALRELNACGRCGEHTSWSNRRIDQPADVPYHFDCWTELEAERAEDAGYRDGYCNVADERRCYPPGANPDYDRGFALGKAGKDGHPNNRFSRQTAKGVRQ